MSDQYRKVSTTYKVWSAIRDSHPELRVFSTYSAPDGDQFGDPNQCRMLTQYGFDGQDMPTIGAETTWDLNREAPTNRDNEKHKYWLFVGISDE